MDRVRFVVRVRHGKECAWCNKAPQARLCMVWQGVVKNAYAKESMKEPEGAATNVQVKSRPSKVWRSMAKNAHGSARRVRTWQGAAKSVRWAARCDKGWQSKGKSMQGVAR